MTQASFLGFESEVSNSRKAFLWDLRDQHEVARGHWVALAGAAGFGAATEVRLLHLFSKVVADSKKSDTDFAAGCFEALRISADVLDASEGFYGPASGKLPAEEARFLGEWLIPLVLERALERGDLDLAPTLARLIRSLAIGRNSERVYRQREDPGDFDAVSLGILYGVVEAKYARPARFAAETGARLSGASSVSLQRFGHVGEGIGKALGYLAVLDQGWDRRVLEQTSLQRHHIRSGRDAVREIEGGLVLLRSQDDYELKPLEKLAEDLDTHFKKLNSQIERHPMQDSDPPGLDEDSTGNGKAPKKWEAPIIPPIDGEEKPEVPSGDKVADWESPIIPKADS